MKCRKLLAILLALVMVIGLLPFAALADGSQDSQPGYTQGADSNGEGNQEPEPEPEPEPVPDDSGNLVLSDEEPTPPPPEHHHTDDNPSVTWKSWDGTVKDNNGEKYLDSGYYYLENSLDIASIGKTINIKGDVHLCLNGKTLSGNTPRYGIFQINPDSSLTICDCKGGGVLLQNGSADEAILVTGGTFTLYGGTINAGTSKYAVRVNVNNAPATLNIEGGCITSSNKSGIYGGTSGTANAYINVNDGRIEGVSGIVEVGNKPNTEISVNGGEIVASSTGIQISKGKLIVNDGSISGATGLKTSITEDNGEIRILGGSITGTVDYGVLLSQISGVEDAYAPVYLSGSPTIKGTVADIDLADAKCRLHARYDGQEYSGEKLNISCDSHSLGETVVYDTVNTDLFGVIEESRYLVPGSNNLILSDQEPTPPVEGHKHAADGTDGSEVWTEWGGQSDLKTGYYYLKDNVDISEVLAENNLPLHITGDVHLCLNGKTLEGSAETLAALIEISTGASLTICDCGEGGTLKRTKASVTSSRGCVIDNSSGTLILYDGTIQNDANDRTYAVTVSSSNGAASFEMYQDATIRSIGTGIRLYGGSNATTATIHGGTIEYAGASGISVEKDFKNSTLTIENISIDPETSGEQGLYILSGTVNIQDGNIRGKQYGAKIYTAQNNGETHISGGTLHGDAYGIEITLPAEENTCARVYLSNAPIIDGNTADIHYVKNTSMLYAKDGENAYSGDNLSISCPSFVDGDVVVYEGSELQGKFSVVEEGKSLVVQGNNLVLGNEPVGHQDHDATGEGKLPNGAEWIKWDGSAFTKAGYYYLDKNVTLTSTISVTKDVHLCLNGYSITAPEEGGASTMFKIEKSGKLSVCDCQEDGKIEMLRDGSNNMAIQVMKNRTFDLYSGTIYAAGSSSRAVYSNGGTVNVSGGIIESPSTINGALRADGSTAVVNLSGGEIKGAVTLRRGPKVYLSGSPKLTTINIKEESPVEKYAIQIHAESKDKTAPYTGGAIEISTVETNLEPGHIVVYNVNENNDELFTLKDNRIVHEGDNLVIAADSAIKLTVTPPDFTYGDPDAVIKVTTVPADATVTFSRYIDDPGTLGTIDPKTGKLTGFDAGTFTVTVTATKDGYTAASKEVIFTVKKRDVTITAKKQTIDYEDGDIIQGADQVTASGLANKDAVSEITLTANKTAKTITASNAVIKHGNRDVNKNYNISYAPGTLSFSNVPQEGFAITGRPDTVTYGNTFTLTATGGSSTGAVTWSATGAATVDREGNVTITGAGAFTITATKAGDDTYAEATATYQAAAQKRALTIAANDATIAFNAAAPAYTATVTGAMPADETTITGAYTLSCNYVPGDAVGEYPITVTANLTTDLTAKYDLTTTNGTLHVTKAAAEVTTAPTAKTDLVYTGTAQALVTAGTATGGTMVYSLSKNGTYTEAIPEGTIAGTYTVWYKVKGDGNHNDTAPQSISVSIGKAKLTVKANDLSINEGSPVPTYTASYSGFVNGETETDLSGKLTFTCDYTTSSKPGTYDIKPSGLTSDNYAITFQNGTLTVVAVGEIFPPIAKDLTYAGKAQKLIDPAQAAVDVDLFYKLDGSSFSKTIPEAKNAGTYTVYWKAEKNGSTVDNGSLNVTIRKAPLTVTADDIWVYAGDTPKFTATIKGYVNGEDWRVLKGELTFTCGYSEKYSKPGSRYTITPKGLTADNYDITFKTGTLTVKDPLSPRFNVYVLESKHGTVEADCRYARKGDVVTLTIKPDWGYELETLTVTDSHGYELKLTYHNNGTYTFTMPRDNVTVKAIFTVRDMPFVDVPGDAWYAGGVRYVYAHGLMNGTGNWHFSPNRTTTRAMIATILYRMEGSPRVYGTSQFGDVEVGSWYEDAVIWATQNDIVEGYTSKTFGPNDPITREQMAAMLYRYADYCRCDMSAGRYVDLSKFSDMDKISGYAIPALRWAVGEEIIEGRTGKRLAPTDTATRAEVAVMLMRFCEEVIW